MLPAIKNKVWVKGQGKEVVVDNTQLLQVINKAKINKVESALLSQAQPEKVVRSH